MSLLVLLFFCSENNLFSIIYILSDNFFYCLEQASSSQSSASTTATTSSATSMTSLDPDHEHDTQNTQNTNSDCDWDCWDADNWGDMEQQSTATSSVPLNPTSSISPSGHSPKANEQWTSLEEEPVCHLTFYNIFVLSQGSIQPDMLMRVVGTHGHKF